MSNPRKKSRGSTVLGELTQHLWLLRESTLKSLCTVLTRHATGNKLEPSEIESFIAARESRCEVRRDQLDTSRPYAIVDGIAVVPVTGLIVKYANLVNGSSQPRGTSMEWLKRTLQTARGDDAATEIVLDFDSPGGSSVDVAETADLIARIDAKDKPVSAVVDGAMCCSGATWLACAARAIYATRASEIGSIGVWSVMVDESQAAADEGIKVHVLRYGERKNIGMIPGEVVTQEAIDHYMQTVNAIGDMFVAAVQKGRGMTAEEAKSVADGAVHFATEAKRLGLVDEIVRDFDHAIQRIRAARNHASEGGGSGGRAASYQLSEETHMSEPQKPTRYESAQKLAEAQPDIAAALQAQGAEGERKRITAIHTLAERGQEKLRDKLVSNGTSLEDASRELHLDLKARMQDREKEIAKDREVLGLPESEQQAVAPEVFQDTVAGARPDAGSASKIARDWDANKDGCRAKFGDFELYVAHVKNEEALAPTSGGGD